MAPDAVLLERIGGRPVVDLLVDQLYAGIDADAGLRPMFVADLAGERAKQKNFFCEWLGGRPEWTHHHAYSGLQHRHSHIHITRTAADAWLGHFEQALGAAVESAQLRQDILQIARPLARSFVNEEGPPARPTDLRCRRLSPFRSIRQLAGKGDAVGLTEALHEQPQLVADAIEMAEVLLEASLKGRTQVVETLLDAGVDPNIPAHYKEGCIFQSFLLTPLCGALAKNRLETAQLLRTRGALYDIFSASYLGDLAAVADWVGRDPELAMVTDPASDVLQYTPVHHAVYGGHTDLVTWLLAHGAQVGKNSSAMVKHAANNHLPRLVHVLLEHGADATRVGPGPWVLAPEISTLLLARGADVNYPAGHWIWRSCTGNNSQRDNPDLVARLLACGADPQTRLRGATALHYTAKAGFLRTTQALLEHGCDIEAVSDDGDTALMYAMKAGKRADVAAMVALLVTHGAKIDRANAVGTTFREMARRSRRGDADEIRRVLQSAREPRQR